MTRRGFLCWLAAGFGIVLSRRLLIGGEGAFSPPADTPPSVFTVSSSVEGGWTWFVDPRAVYYNGFTYWGYVNSHGDVTARAWNHSTTSSVTLVAGNRLFAGMETDDHADPSVLVRDSDKKLLYFYTRHSGAELYLSISAAAEDISSFAARVNLDSQVGGTQYTYPNPHQLLSETNDPIWLYYRDPSAASENALRYTKSTDGGATWSAGTILYKNTARSSYWKIVSNSADRVDFAISDGHPMYDADVSIYHCYYQGGSYFKTDGSSAGSLPLDPSDLTLIYDGTGAADTAWIWDLAVDYSGTPTPYVVYTTYPSTTDHRYNYGRWTGSAWVTHEIVAGGTYIPTAIASGGSQLEVYYSGGVVLDQGDPTKVYASVQNGSGRWDLHRYITANGGTSWSGTTLTSTAIKNIRPASVRNHAPELKVLWMTASPYESYSSWDTGTGGSDA